MVPDGCGFTARNLWFERGPLLSGGPVGPWAGRAMGCLSFSLRWLDCIVVFSLRWDAAMLGIVGLSRVSVVFEYFFL